VTQAFADKIQADGYAEDASGAVELVRRLTNKPPEGSSDLIVYSKRLGEKPSPLGEDFRRVCSRKKYSRRKG